MKANPVAKLTPSLQEIEANPLIPYRSDVTGMVSMGFDLSSSCCGWAVMENVELVRYGKIVFRSTAGIGEKLDALHELVRLLMRVYRPDVVVLESPLSRHNKVTSRHYELVGIVRATVAAQMKYEVEQKHFIATATIKKTLGVPKGRDHDHNKEMMVNRINDLFDLNLLYAKAKNQSDDDIADAIAVLYTWHSTEGGT